MSLPAFSVIVPLMFKLPLETIVPLVAILPFAQKFPQLTVIAPSASDAANSIYGYDFVLSSA